MQAIFATSGGAPSTTVSELELDPEVPPEPPLAGAPEPEPSPELDGEPPLDPLPPSDIEGLSGCTWLHEATTTATASAIDADRTDVRRRRRIQVSLWPMV